MQRSWKTIDASRLPPQVFSSPLRKNTSLGFYLFMVLFIAQIYTQMNFSKISLKHLQIHKATTKKPPSVLMSSCFSWIMLPQKTQSLCKPLFCLDFCFRFFEQKTSGNQWILPIPPFYKNPCKSIDNLSERGTINPKNQGNVGSHGSGTKNQKTRWWQLKYFWNFHTYLGFHDPIWTCAFFSDGWFNHHLLGGSSHLVSS